MFSRFLIKTMKQLLSFEDVQIGYGNKPISHILNFSLYENDFIGLVGPNGAGKTTLLKTVLGNLKPISGVIKKQDIRFGYVPQRDVVQPLLPYSVFDVVMMGRYSLMGLFKKPRPEDKHIVLNSLEHTGILHLKDVNYNSLSGGQRQRTLIARALAVQPNVLILDEPTNGMDTPSHHMLLDIIVKLHDKDNLTIILVSHLLTDVANTAKKIMLLEKELFQFGLTEEILSEDNLNRTYSSNFKVTRIENKYLITSGEK